jgi:hypothetical protein
MSQTLFDWIFEEMDRLIEDGMDPCVAACTWADSIHATFDGVPQEIIKLSPSECLLIWELGVQKRREDSGR